MINQHLIQLILIACILSRNQMRLDFHQPRYDRYAGYSQSKAPQNEPDLQLNQIYSLFSCISMCYLCGFQFNQARGVLKINVKLQLQIRHNIYITVGMQQIQQQQMRVKQPSAVKSLKTASDSKKVGYFYGLGCKAYLAYEVYFKILYVVSTIFSAVLLRKVYQFQTFPQFSKVREGTLSELLYISLPFAIVYTLADILIHYLLDPLCVKYYINETKYEGKSREKRAFTLVKWAYSIFYYFFSSIIAFLLIKDTSFFPTWLGGSGSCMNLVVGAPALPEATQHMKIFYLVQFGKHSSRLFSHMFIKAEGNYYEYILHHALSTFLILFSYLTNQWLIGIMVLLCHDTSDLFLIISRGYKDYKNYSKVLLKISYVITIIFWVGGRLIVFPACCVYASLVGASIVSETLTPLESDVLMLPYRWMGFMLVGLLVMQVFWTYYIMKAFVEVNISEKIASNTYEQPTNEE